jgi:tRNA U34 5-methylaminomethyl-2-thiouridine-forming methyltransferase MnmC
MMDILQVIATGDGSHSLLNTALNETYHSVHGAIQESRHVFILHGLQAAEQAHPSQPISILEIGFGTGLNTLLTWMRAKENNTPIIYETWEKYPLPESILLQLNYATELEDTKSFDTIHRAPWNVVTMVAPGFSLLKKQGDVLVDPIEGSYELIYFDAFAPSKQPELWTKDVLKKVTERLLLNGILVTYCAKGQVKRDLASLGLQVESPPGPPGKKEMTRASRRT